MVTVSYFTQFHLTVKLFKHRIVFEPVKSVGDSSCCYNVICSESSMFITRNRFILKTCGKTTLLAAIKPLLELVYEKCGFDIILVLYTVTLLCFELLISLCVHIGFTCVKSAWLSSRMVERQSLAGVLSPSCTRPVADG